MIRPTRRLLILATLGLFASLASLWSPWAGAMVFLTWGGLFVAELIGLEVGPPVVVVQTPNRVSVGQTFEARVRLASTRGTFGRRLSLECSEGLDAGAEVSDTRTPGDGKATLGIEVTARRRGTPPVRSASSRLCIASRSPGPSVFRRTSPWFDSSQHRPAPRGATQGWSRLQAQVPGPSSTSFDRTSPGWTVVRSTGNRAPVTVSFAFDATGRSRINSSF